MKREPMMVAGHAPMAAMYPLPQYEAVPHDFQSAFGAHDAPAWGLRHSPYSDEEYESSTAIPLLQPHPPQLYPTPESDSPPYGPIAAYSRHGSIAAPTQSPNHVQSPGFRVMNGNPRTAQLQTQPGYSPRHARGMPEEWHNGKHSPVLATDNGHEGISSQLPRPAQHVSGSSATHAKLLRYGSIPGPGHEQKQKPSRAQQACDACRQRKARCDEGRPACQHCKNNNLKCAYRELPPPKSEKHVAALQDQVDEMKRMLSTNEEISKTIEKTSNTILRLILGKYSTNSTSQMQRLKALQKAIPAGLAKSFTDGETLESRSGPPTPSVSFVSETMPYLDHDKRSDHAPMPKVVTAASNLLSWPSVRALIPKGLDGSYVMNSERENGLQWVHNQAEWDNNSDGFETTESSAISSPSCGGLEDETLASTPTGRLLLAPSHNVFSKKHLGRVNPVVGMNLDSDIVDQGFRRYMDNIHILHPILEPQELRHMIRAFKANYSWDYASVNRPVASAGQKRKGGPGGHPVALDELRITQGNPLNEGHSSRTRPVIEHSASNAVILLVIALGEIVADKGQLSGSASSSFTYSSRPQSPHSELQSQASAFGNFPLSSKKHTINGSPSPTTSTSANLTSKSTTSIPGLAYYTEAAAILGELSGSTNIKLVQANILAGLFMSQLAKIIPSHHYIYNACRICQILIDSPDFKAKTMKPAFRKSIVLAFWTSLQLESDILAEIDLPESNINRFVSTMETEMIIESTASDGVEIGTPEDVQRYYLNQVQLRRELNAMYTHLFMNLQMAQEPPLRLIDAINKNMEEWRKKLDAWNDNWDDNDHQSDDINVARMRAKYYGAKYITNRLVLQWALSLDSKKSQAARPSQSPVRAGPRADNVFVDVSRRHTSETCGPAAAEVSADQRRHERLDRRHMKYANTCVQAAIRSTTAFDKVDNLVVTNIFGTAHAQFGNVLVLAATYNSPNPDLSGLVGEQTLRELLTRTIGFLKNYENISPVLKKDAEILQHVEAKLFPKTTYPKEMTTSFCDSFEALV